MISTFTITPIEVELEQWLSGQANPQIRADDRTIEYVKTTSNFDVLLSFLFDPEKTKIQDVWTSSQPAKLNCKLKLKYLKHVLHAKPPILSQVLTIRSMKTLQFLTCK